MVKDKLKGRAANREEPALRRLRALGLETPEKIEALVKAEFGDTGDKGRARNVLAAMLVSRSGLRPAEVARRLGVSPSAITRSVLRIDQAAAKDPNSLLKKSFYCERLHSTQTSFSTGNRPQCGFGPRFRPFPVSGLVCVDFARSRYERLSQQAAKFARRLRTVSSNLLMKNQSGHEA